jgi:putative SOS response-associated peptidase YedK
MQVNPNNVFEEDLPPSYNVSPETYQPIVRLSSDSGERELALLRRGLVPFWSKGGKALFSSINARAETLETSAAYREAFQMRRCLVPADFFYEWVRAASCSDDCPAWPDDRTCRPIGSTLGGQAVW